MPVLPLVGSTMMVSGLILPGLFRRVNHRHADAVFDAVRRIVEFQLGDHVAPRSPASGGAMRTSGVLPINSVTSFAIFMSYSPS